VNETRKQSELEGLFVMKLAWSRYPTVAKSSVLQVSGKKLNIVSVRQEID
jgi:hypothetical protein